MDKRAWLLVPLVFLMGCVEAQPPVSRVQPNVTRKTDLLGGEWYSQSTVVDVPYSTDFTFVGESGQLERINWEIQEGFLVARRSYESIAGAEPEGINGTTDAQGAVVAMYAIESHFDIRREYNPVTGEEYNVIVENTSDRPWNEREFMRVDWSTNLIEDPNFLMLSRYFDGVQAEPVSWYVQDQDDPNAPRFERLDPTDDSSPLGYMEITNKLFVHPTTVNLWGLTLPSCALYQWMDGNPVDCAPGEITVRNSFLRVDAEDTDYSPTVYTGDRMDRFGYFITERPGYDNSYGLTEPLRYRFINRHNLWMESHRKNGDGSVMACTTNTDCDDGQGSVCDLDYGRSRRALNDERQIVGACTIPYRNRELRPVVYHMTENYPEELKPEMRMLEEEYNETFLEVVGSLREQECLAHGGSACDAERTRETQAFYVCDSPVPAGAPAACGAEGTIARIGDLRFSLLGYVNEPHRSSPLGYGPSAADPLTGEIISGTAFLYGAGVETYAAMARDIVRLLNGDLSEEDIASGAPVEEWVRRMSAGTEGHDHAVPVDASDLPRLNDAMDFSWAQTGSSANRGAASDPADFVNRMADGLERLDRTNTFGTGVDTAHAALSRLEGTEFEQMLVTRDARMAAGIDPDLPVSDEIIEAASPLRRMRLDRISAISRARNQLQEQQGLDFGEFADSGLLGLARAVQRAAQNGGTMEWSGVTYNIGSGGNIDYDAVRDMLRHPILSGLALHEVGHTVGLRHNFSGSYDSMNYAPEYWQLRDDGNMHPRAWDPMSQAETDGRISEYAYSTVMDYGNNFVVTDAGGLGHYDHAAIKMGYGDLVEVFQSVPDSTEMAWFNWVQASGWPVNIRLSSATGGALEAYHYTEQPALVGGRENIERRADVPYTSLRPEAQLGAWGFDDRLADAQGRVVVPYRFCSDEQADLSPGCYRYDSGADPYESVQSVIDSYWNYYIFTSFRRNRIGFNAGGVADRIYGRYFEKLSRANQTYALYRAVFQEVWGDSPGFDEFWTAERGMGSWTAAVGASYQTLTRVVTAPEPGGYGTGTRADGTTALLPGGDEVEIDGFDGRYIETTWNFDAGYFWFDQLERVGYFYDKALALMVLTDPTTHFVGRDTDADIRRYQLNFANTFGPSMTAFFGGLLGEDWQTVAPRVQGGVVTYPDPLEIEQGDMPGTPLSPNASFSIQLYAAIFGMALIPQTYDQDFLNRSRIWVAGGAEEVTIDPTLPTVEYLDRDSGITYVAASYLSGGQEQGVGALLIQRANLLASRAATNQQAAIELESFVDNLDMIRRLTWELGFGAQP